MGEKRLHNAATSTNIPLAVWPWILCMLVSGAGNASAGMMGSVSVSPNEIHRRGFDNGPPIVANDCWQHPEFALPLKVNVQATAILEGRHAFSIELGSGPLAGTGDHPDPLQTLCPVVVTLAVGRRRDPLQTGEGWLETFRSRLPRWLGLVPVPPSAMVGVSTGSDVAASNRTIVYQFLVGVVVLAFGMFFFWRNRSQQKKIQHLAGDLLFLNARVEATSRAVHEGILVCGVDGAVLDTDADLARIFGVEVTEVQHANDALQRFVLPYVSQDDAFVCFWETAFADRTLTASQEFYCGMTKGWLSVYTSPIYDDTKNFRGRIWTFDDITKRKHLEEEYLQSQKMSAIGRLAGGVAHDFNNLLQVIGSSLESLSVETQSIHQHDQFSTATSAVLRASDLTKRLLTFARRTTLQTRTVPMKEVVGEVKSLMANMLGANIRFLIEMDPTIGAVEGDASQLEQVLVNLCINARDALTQRTGTIRLIAKNAAHETLGATIYLSVIDDGVGIPDELQSRVFEPFFTTKPVGEGTGLGMAIAFGVVQQHKGLMYCHSIIGEGTRIEIYLPRSEVAEPRSESKPSAVETSFWSKTPRRILLVDDDLLVRQSTRLLLSQLGHQVEDVLGGEEALALLAGGESFDVVILDLTMPEMSGHETLEQMKLLYPDLPVILCSGISAEPSAVFADVLVQADAFLGKPYRVEDISRLLTSLTVSQST